MMKKKLALLLTICILLCVIPKTNVFAATKYKAVYDYNTSKLMVKTTAGKTICTLNVSGLKVGTKAAFNGDVVYFTADNRNKTEYGMPTECYLYCRNLNTGHQVRLKRLPKSYSFWEVTDIYNKKVYLRGSNPSDADITYIYSIKEKNLKKVCNSGYSKRVGTRIICGDNSFGSIVNYYPLYLINAKTGNGKCIEKYCSFFTIGSKNVYFAQHVSGTTGYDATYSIKKYTYETGKITTLVNQIKASYVDKLTNNYVYISRVKYNGQTFTKTYYRYDIKNKALKKMSYSDYFSEIQSK